MRLSFSQAVFALGALAALVSPESAGAAVYQGGSIREGIDAALGALGVGSAGDLGSFIRQLISALRSYVTILGILAIVVAGFYLLLGFGSESAKDTAKRIILYTLIAIIVINLAEAIVNLFVGLSQGQISTDLPNRICSILVTVLGYVAFIGTIAIIVAGFYLLLGFGSEDAKGTAQRIIIYTIAGILIIAFAAAIVNIAFLLSDSFAAQQTFTCNTGLGDPASVDLRGTLLGLLDTALSFLALFAVIAIVIAGFMLVLSLGSEELRQRAVRIILYTIAGLLVIFFVRVIVAFFLGLGSSV